MEIAESVWDFNGRTLNMHIDLFNAAIVPVWRGRAFYWVEPLLTLLIEIFYERLHRAWKTSIQDGQTRAFDECATSSPTRTSAERAV